MRIGSLWFVVALLVFAGALWGFMEVADEVGEGDTHHFDTALLMAMRQPSDPNIPIGPTWLSEAARDVTSLGSTSVLVLLTVASVGYLWLVGQRSAALLTVAAVAGGAILSAALKSGFSRPRPDLVPHAVEVYSASFPSGHAMLATVTYLTLGSLLAQVQSHNRARIYLIAWAIALSLLIGVSRVYLGVHWPTDVIAGWCIGAAWALMCACVERWLQRRGVVRREQT